MSLYSLMLCSLLAVKKSMLPAMRKAADVLLVLCFWLSQCSRRTLALFMWLFPISSLEILHWVPVTTSSLPSANRAHSLSSTLRSPRPVMSSLFRLLGSNMNPHHKELSWLRHTNQVPFTAEDTLAAPQWYLLQINSPLPPDVVSCLLMDLQISSLKDFPSWAKATSV